MSFPGGGFSPDRMLQDRLFSYGVSLGVTAGPASSHHQIPVSLPSGCAPGPTHCDGSDACIRSEATPGARSEQLHMTGGRAERRQFRGLRAADRPARGPLQLPRGRMTTASPSRGCSLRASPRRAAAAALREAPRARISGYLQEHHRPTASTLGTTKADPAYAFRDVSAAIEALLDAGRLPKAGTDGRRSPARTSDGDLRQAPPWTSNPADLHLRVSSPAQQTLLETLASLAASLRHLARRARRPQCGRRTQAAAGRSRRAVPTLTRDRGRLPPRQRRRNVKSARHCSNEARPAEPECKACA